MEPIDRPVTTIRKARPADVARLYDVWFTAVEATHDFVTAADRAALARLVKQDYLPNADLDVVVDAEDRPLAFMGMTGSAIDSLFVHDDCRRAGLGRRLVEFACERADVVTADVNEQNRQGVGFWRAMGFRQVGRSATDGQGRPYPILHLERSAARPAGRSEPELP